MKKITSLFLIVGAALLLVKPVYAAFPDDLSDVVFVEAPFVKNWPATGTMTVSVSGGNIFMPYSKANVWRSVFPRSLENNAVNANAWGIVQINGVWHAGTWEYLRPGTFIKEVKAFGGCCHFKPPISNFTLVNGRDYGIFLSGVVRDPSGGINAQERTNYVVYRWGQGTIYTEGSPLPEPEPPVIQGALNLLMEEPAPD